jgi:DNA-binding CsgD family transcriptional regulator
MTMNGTKRIIDYQRSLSVLTPAQAEVMRLFCGDPDATETDVAETLGISQPAVHQRLAAAIEKIKKSSGVLIKPTPCRASTGRGTKMNHEQPGDEPALADVPGALEARFTELQNRDVAKQRDELDDIWPTPEQRFPYCPAYSELSMTFTEGRPRDPFQAQREMGDFLDDEPYEDEDDYASGF